MQDSETGSENLSSATILVTLRNSKGDFHKYASDNAYQRSLTGYSQELPEGLYKVHLEGEKSDISAFIGYLEMNRAFDKVDTIAVEDVMVSWSSYSGKYSDFSVME
ncbi:acylphosphatase [Methanolobus sp. WCC4]|uniref:acylphosphatase n=1 Tax=Methanolobus sp. WCC4 TaxID=3125784 RepID=UPI0030FC9D86